MLKEVREVRFNEFEQLLNLYKYLNPDDPELPIDKQLTQL
jgi:hypothetical protein